MDNKKESIDKEKKNIVENVKGLAKSNKAAALGLAVFLTVSTALTGCAAYNEKEEEDDSYYTGGGGGGYHGGTYFYARGGSYSEGTWSKSYLSTTGKSGYSSPRGGSVGG